MRQIFVTYEGAPGARFDRDYYVSRHLPLVMECWQHYGLYSVSAFFPADQGDGECAMAICDCRFRDDAAVQVAFASREADAVMADIARFTDIKPRRLRVLPGETR